MNPSFFHDYREMIVQEPQAGRFGRIVFYRCHAQDMDGDAVLGCRGSTPAEAYWSLCDFIDVELERRRLGKR